MTPDPDAPWRDALPTWPDFPLPTRGRLALVVPADGRVAASALLTLMNHGCVVPLHAAEERPTMLARMRAAGVRCVFDCDAARAAELAAALEAEGGDAILAFAVSAPSSSEAASVAPARFARVRGEAPPAAAGPPMRPSAGDDTVLILHTSGTTGASKRVPFTLARLWRSGAALAASMGLRADDVGLNMMPMHHVGGIACNLFAPLASGGAMVHAPRGFDAAGFWALAKSHRVTWVYMVPSMWAMALRAGPKHDPDPAPALRIVRSGAASLPHELATQLRARFVATAPTVLPTYSMTECMPIATPPPGYALDRPGAVGPAYGVTARVVDREGAPVAAGVTGEIVLSEGEGDGHLFAGYEGDGADTLLARPSPFPTGDLGHVDADGWLHVTGRAKEAINRGGELLSPVEIEAALAAVLGETADDCMVFAAPHAELGETVGVAVTEAAVDAYAARTSAAAGEPMAALLEELRGGAVLAPHKRPQVLVRVAELPRTHGTRKLQRAGFAQRVALATTRGGRAWATVATLATLAESPHEPPRPAAAPPPTPAVSAVADALGRLAEAIPTHCAGRHVAGDRVARSASGTAKYTLRLRYLAHALGFGTDPLAAKLMPTFWETEWPREWEELHTQALRLLHRETGGLGRVSSVWSELFRAKVAAGEVCDGNFAVGYLHGRTCFFDDVVRAHRDCAQLVILGAGFDTRCYRMAAGAERPRRCFEVDAPTTQACKRECLARAGIAADHVTFVGVDFAAAEDWMARLCAAGFDPDLPTLVLWEGVSYYLPRAAVQDTMNKIAGGCRVARVVYDVYYSWFSEDARVAALMRKGFGEPLVSGVDFGREDAPSRDAGLATVSIVRPTEANAAYGPHDARGALAAPAFGAFAMVVASTTPQLPRVPPTAAAAPYCAAEPAADPADPAVDPPTAADPVDPPTSACVVALPPAVRDALGLAGDEEADLDTPLVQLGLDSLALLELYELVDDGSGVDGVDESCTLRSLCARLAPAS
jgi:methyltransferase (TIGR00027 family)